LRVKLEAGGGKVTVKKTPPPKIVLDGAGRRRGPDLELELELKLEL
jgi:hypothetical protein